VAAAKTIYKWDERGRRRRAVPEPVIDQLDAHLALMGVSFSYGEMEPADIELMMQTAYLVLRETGRRPIEIAPLDEGLDVHGQQCRGGRRRWDRSRRVAEPLPDDPSDNPDGSRAPHRGRGRGEALRRTWGSTGGLDWSLAIEAVQVSLKRKREAITTMRKHTIDRSGRPAPFTSTTDYEAQSVAVPSGNCREPSNVKAGGKAYPIRFQCAGCGFYRPDPSYLPAIEQHVNDLRADLETARAMDADDFVVRNLTDQIAAFGSGPRTASCGNRPAFTSGSRSNNSATPTWSTASTSSPRRTCGCPRRRRHHAQPAQQPPRGRTRGHRGGGTAGDHGEHGTPAANHRA